jgi:hypothetical protein
MKLFWQLFTAASVLIAVYCGGVLPGSVRSRSYRVDLTRTVVFWLALVATMVGTFVLIDNYIVA